MDSKAVGTRSRREDWGYTNEATEWRITIWERGSLIPTAFLSTMLADSYRHNLHSADSFPQLYSLLFCLSPTALRNTMLPRSYTVILYSATSLPKLHLSNCLSFHSVSAFPHAYTPLCVFIPLSLFLHLSNSPPLAHNPKLFFYTLFSFPPQSSSPLYCLTFHLTTCGLPYPFTLLLYLFLTASISTFSSYTQI